MKGVLPWLARWALHAGIRDFCPALAALVGPVQKIFFLAVHYFKSFVPIAQLGRQSCRVPVSYCVSLVGDKETSYNRPKIP
jgi:hypothetical protein